jgi:hypothetical protein
MPHESTTAGLNDNHRRRVFATCKHLDKLLASIETTAAACAPEGGGALFHRHAQSLSPDVRAEVAAWVRQFREMIKGVLARHRIALPPPVDDQRFAIASTLGFMDLDMEELRPEHMKGYGVLDDRAAADLDAIVGELRAHIQVLVSRLQQAPGAGAPG